MSGHEVTMDWIEERGVESALYKPFELGKAYYFRCAVYSCVGRVVGYDPAGQFLTLDNAAYIGTDGRYSDFLADGNHDSAEIEPLPPECLMRLGLRYINDAADWNHKVPLERK